MVWWNWILVEVSKTPWFLVSIKMASEI